MKNPKFSAPGEALTAFELQLLANAKAGGWAALGQRIGPAALAVLLEELGGTKQYIPARAGFFEQLYRQERDAEIRAALEGGEPQAKVASRYRISQSRVSCIGRAGAARKSGP